MPSVGPLTDSMHFRPNLFNCIDADSVKPASKTLFDDFEIIDLISIFMIN